MHDILSDLQIDLGVPSVGATYAFGYITGPIVTSLGTGTMKIGALMAVVPGMEVLRRQQ